MEKSQELLAVPPAGGPALRMDGMRQGDWMQTFTGVQFWPLDPLPSEINIEDIAHSLANQCRFAGHVQRFYSVAQHSVLVSRIVPRQHALWGLLHDATEAYLVDLPRPVKRYSRLGEEYRGIEARLMQAICVRFDLPFEEPRCVKYADDVLLMTEKRDLMPNSPAKWRETADPLPYPIVPWAPISAEEEFLATFDLMRTPEGPAHGPDGTRASNSSESK
jgi:uncharacterized protein